MNQSIVEFIVRHAGLAEDLLDEHINDGRGYCRACAVGAQRGYHSFPCSVARSAERARQVQAERRATKD